MYILSGKGSVAGADLAHMVVRRSQERGVLWDNDLPEYTLDFATQIPSVSRSIREKREAEVIAAINTRLRAAEANHNHYMLLCVTAHKLIPRLNTRMHCINLLDAAMSRLDGADSIAWLGTAEGIPQDDPRFITLPDHADRLGDLITSVKRGYAALGTNYAAHPRHLFTQIVEEFKTLGAESYFLGCTDLHECAEWLLEFGIKSTSIVDVISVAADEVIRQSNHQNNASFFDELSDSRTFFRYKYISASDAPQTDKKRSFFLRLLNSIPDSKGAKNILDLGGSSTGDSLRVAKHFGADHSHITLLDISAASLDAAKPIYSAASNITCDYIEGSLEDYTCDNPKDCILCLGVLLCLSADSAFESAVHKIGQMLKPGGILLTRDCLHNVPGKAYMAFGGVIRNRDFYDAVFEAAGLTMLDRNEFTIETPIQRDIVTTCWVRSVESNDLTP